eukprot:CAMPEP_0116564860 /NCGR_PEP_ID=MMETSP0397-20121206/13572_1 /TAXON_ID=216820 /ORGANISM="Cyclophora tenuis, Strain ECT3854" /LENGTH=250 /DNA_ID=CAMNT_0004091559 /DNA_START=221 /DNA_END=973 /DNA_ORIENTATION=-
MPSIDRQVVRSMFTAFSDDELKPYLRLFTMVSDQHLDLALEAVAKVNSDGIDGDIVECGVWKGGVTMGMIIVNQRYNIDRNFWLFDTFEGLPEPVDEKNGLKAKKVFEALQSNASSEEITKREITRSIEFGKWNYGPLDVVRNNIYYTGYPRDKIRFVKGKVEETLGTVNTTPAKIAILRLDTDWYESTKVELEILYDKLQPGGLLIIDDFCSWEGSQRASNEFFRDRLNLSANKVSKTEPCLHFWKPKK